MSKYRLVWFTVSLNPQSQIDNFLRDTFLVGLSLIRPTFGILYTRVMLRYVLMIPLIASIYQKINF